MSKRVILAVGAGYVTNAAFIAGAEYMLSPLLSARAYFAADAVSQCVVQIGCGCLCSWIANAQRLTATVVLIIVGLLIGSVSVVASWGSEPHWYAITLLCVYAPCVWIGYHLERHFRS
jgi:hypothetical protein